MSDHDIARVRQQLDVFSSNVTRKFAQTKARREELKGEIDRVEALVSKLEEYVVGVVQRFKIRLDKIEEKLIEMTPDPKKKARTDA